MKDERVLFSIEFWKYLTLSFFLIFFTFLSISIVRVSAQSGSYEQYNVDIVVNEDSSMDVTETVVTRWLGEFHFINRDLTLSNRVNLQKCQTDSTLQCGGFSYVKIIGVFDGDGNQVPSNELEMSTSNDSVADYLTVKWAFAPNGKNFDNEQFKYSIKYKVFGGLGYFPAYDLFYWNMLPGNRPSSIDSSTMQIIFPKKITFDLSDLKVLSNEIGGTLKHNTTFNNGKNTIIVTATNVAINYDFTVMYKFPKNIIQKYATLNLITSPDPINIEVNGISVANVSKTLSGLVPGENKLIFSSSGYESKEVNLNLTVGEIKELNVTLDKSLLTRIFEILNICGICLGLLSIPLGLVLIYAKWSKNGRDNGVARTIIPEYGPPDKMQSYLVGSLKDEKVDLIDITSTIIDLAYRGYIKIREYTTGKILGFGGTKEYEFTKVKEAEGLSQVEKDLFSGIFEAGEKTTLSDLKYKFYKHIPTIKKDIYDEMVTKNYFKESPDKTRSKYLGYGIGLIFLSFILFFALGSLFFIGLIVLAFAGSAFINGIALIIVSNYMPAKTEHGLRIFEKIKGFRMYMYTTERFRVQDLTPETFEKYLSYAICFKIETKWADRFKDIYKQAPDWFQTEDINTFTTLYFINSLSSFHTASVSALTTSYQSSSSSGGGGGWSGGGGFSGGFSGGGGGGGGSGWG